MDAPPLVAMIREIRNRLEQTILLEPDEEEEDWIDCSFRALGSACSLYFQGEDQESPSPFRLAALDWLAGFEARFSRYLPGSTVGVLNAQAGTGRWTETDADLEALLNLCDAWHFQTRGAFDATCLPLSRLWDWKQTHRTLPCEAEIRATAALTGWNAVEREPGRVRLTRPGMELDLGGVGKEYAADRLRALGRQFGLQHLMVSLGGDVTVMGEPPEGGYWEVGLEHPEEPGNCHCGIALHDGMAVATSGDYRRFFARDGIRYGHIIDCRTGRPASHGTHAVSVIAPSCTQAGLLATAAMIQGGVEALAELERTRDVEGCIWKDGRLMETRGFRQARLPDDWDEDDDEAEEARGERSPS